MASQRLHQLVPDKRFLILPKPHHKQLKAPLYFQGLLMFPILNAVSSRLHFRKRTVVR